MEKETNDGRRRRPAAKRPRNGGRRPMFFQIDEGVGLAFRLACMANGMHMRDVLESFMRDYPARAGKPKGDEQ